MGLLLNLHSISRLAAIWLLLAPLAGVHALEAARFNELLSALQQQQPESVTAYLQNEAASATTDPDYSVLLLNHAFANWQHNRMSSGKEGAMASNNISQAIKSTQQNLTHFPQYLDIHLGIVAVAMATYRLDVLGDELVNILKVSRDINNQWQWGKVGGMQGEAEHFMLDNVQRNVARLFRMQNDMADQQLIRISEALIQYYPKNIYGYANLGVLALANKNYKKAREYLRKAQEIDPEDAVVKGNLERLKVHFDADD